MNPSKSLVDNLKKLVSGLSKDGVLPVTISNLSVRTYLRNDELPEVAEELALYNSGYVADKNGFNLSLVPYKQKFVI